MNKRDSVFITLIICSIFLNIYQYKHVEKLNNGISKPYKVDASTKVIGTAKEKSIQLKEGCEILLYDKLNNFPYVPASGPLAILNPYGINSSNSPHKIKILDQEDEFFTRISIEGIIPTWTIQENGSKIIQSVDNKIMYILGTCDGLLSPIDNSAPVIPLTRGNAVTIKREYEDWYYVTPNVYYDSCMYQSAWVKKNNLGYYDDFGTNIGIDVKIKEGTPLLIENSETLRAEKGYLWGTISKEMDEQYEVGLPGAWSVIVDKKYIEPFIRKPSSLIE